MTKDQITTHPSTKNGFVLFWFFFICLFERLSIPTWWFTPHISAVGWAGPKSSSGNSVLVFHREDKSPVAGARDRK